MHDLGGLTMAHEAAETLDSTLAAFQDALYIALDKSASAQETLGIEAHDNIPMFVLALITPLAHVVKAIEKAS